MYNTTHMCVVPGECCFCVLIIARDLPLPSMGVTCRLTDLMAAAITIVMSADYSLHKLISSE